MPSLAAYRDLMPDDGPWTEDDWRAFRDLTAACRAMREMYGDGGVVGTRSLGVERGIESRPGHGPLASPAVTRNDPAARSNRARRLPTPTADGFWAGLGAEYNEAHANREPEAPHAHYRRSVEWLMHPGNCEGCVCGIKKIRWMAAQPPETHAGRSGRRLAEIYGVR